MLLLLGASPFVGEGSGLRGVAASFAALVTVGNLDGKSPASGGIGNFTVLVHPQWAPLGAARFAELVQARFFDGSRFFRVLKGFMAQCGIAADPASGASWDGRTIEDDPVVDTNKRGRLAFAMSEPQSRTTQIFVNFKDNRFLDKTGFAPFAEVTEGMDVVDRLFAGYGDGPPNGIGPDQMGISKFGNSYLEKDYPRLSYIMSVVPLGGDIPSRDAIYEEAGFSEEYHNDPRIWIVVVFSIVGAIAVAMFCFVFGSRGDPAAKRKKAPSGSELSAASKNYTYGRVGT